MCVRDRPEPILAEQNSPGERCPRAHTPSDRARIWTAFVTERIEPSTHAVVSSRSRCASDYQPECLDCSVVLIVDVRDRPDVQPGAGAVYQVRA